MALFSSCSPSCTTGKKDRDEGKWISAGQIWREEEENEEKIGVWALLYNIGKQGS